MPSDMTVEVPDARVIGIDLHDHTAITGELLHVSALWIIGIDHFAIPISQAHCENEHVMAVHMHRVSNPDSILDRRARVSVMFVKRQGESRLP